MNKRNFMELLRAKWAEGKFVCVGLDSDIEKLPKSTLEEYKLREPVLHFNKKIIDATHDLVAAYKPNLAFYLSRGEQGIKDLQNTIEYINNVAPGTPVILDAKFGDIGNTNEHYAEFAFDYLGADAVTAHNYMGHKAMEPFLKREDKGVIVLCRTSNPGSDEFQFGRYNGEGLIGSQGKRFNMFVAETVDKNWNYNQNCMLVCGATYPDEIQLVRQMTQLPFLIPGIGKQGGDLENSVKNAIDANGQGFLINSSSGIIFASDDENFAQRAREETFKLHDAITKCKKEEQELKNQSAH